MTQPLQQTAVVLASNMVRIHAGQPLEELAICGSQTGLKSESGLGRVLLDFSDKQQAELPVESCQLPRIIR